MNAEPRQRDDYNDRQVEAARRVLVDLGQVLADFHDCLVVVGGWVPDLLLPNAEEPHVGSVDVDLALDAARLNDGRYAEMIKLLLDTTRYRPGNKDFQLVVEVDLRDSERPVHVEVEFLAPKDVKLEKHHVSRAIEIMKQKFITIDSFGPQQVVEFYSAPDAETQAVHARRAYEIVQKLLSLL